MSLSIPCIFTIFISEKSINVHLYIYNMELSMFFSKLSGSSGQPSQEYAEQIFNRLESRKFKKNQTILRARTIPTELFIIKKGIVKVEVEDKVGDTYTCGFHAEDEVIGSFHSYVFQKRSDLRITCLENTEVLCLNFEDFEFISESYPGFKVAFYELLFKVQHRKFIEKSLMITQDARTRYESFIMKHYELLDRIPLKDVASFLGIQQQSLSRLRRAMVS